MSIYVERFIAADAGRVWALTQQPEMHQRWDLRFSRIEYLPVEKGGGPQEFLFETRLGLGLTIRGTGRTTGERREDSGESSSALVFGSQSPISLIRKGSGYWKYAPEKSGMRFATRYDYAVRWGWVGWLLDRAIFRPMMAWATALSFDAVAIWAERGTAPETTRRLTAAYAICRWVLAGVWFYEAVFPKLLGPHEQEIFLTMGAGFSADIAPTIIRALGLIELMLAVLLVVFWRRRWPAWVSLLAMLPAAVMAAYAGPALITAPFNVVVINGMVAALSAAVIVLCPLVASAGNCRWSARGGRAMVGL